ncbi:hypothetical protein PJ311_16205 [Bacillus sp. CLL-7-23]|uniref:DUF4342 domain-containing protein n=1 Tax=Bacillus changyiensis TaxID=3004103 RepID=A0ABT4X7A5_9BACI|nr:hypothetical protein [Bacillus changyiensis]MDA7028118.1 hypothetical protein [Bacillus changyiensis]
MSIKVKRKTGMMGRMTGVSLLVNSEEVTKLSENEEYIIDSTNNILTKIKAKQWNFASLEIEVEDYSDVEIIINPNALLLYIMSMGLMVMGILLTPIITVLGVISMIGTFSYSTKKWFEIKVKKA